MHSANVVSFPLHRNLLTPDGARNISDTYLESLLREFKLYPVSLERLVVLQYKSLNLLIDSLLKLKGF